MVSFFCTILIIIHFLSTTFFFFPWNSVNWKFQVLSLLSLMVVQKLKMGYNSFIWNQYFLLDTVSTCSSRFFAFFTVPSWLLDSKSTCIDIQAETSFRLLSVAFNFGFSSDSLWTAVFYVSLLAKYQNKLKSCKIIGLIISLKSFIKLFIWTQACQFLAKTLNIYPVGPDLLKAQSILLDKIVRRSVVEQEDLRLYWKPTKKSYSLKWSTSLLFTCFSKILLTTERRLMGR